MLARYFALLLSLLIASGPMCPQAFAGNPERTGQAGATQLLIVPFARSAGIGGLNVTTIRGAESIGVNPGGLGYGAKTELIFSHTQWLAGSGIGINSVAGAQNLGGGGVVGVYFSSFSFGDIPITTIDNPDGGLGTFSPSYLNLGISYGRQMVPDRISVGFTVKLINEGITNASATGVAFDAGVQYASRPREGEQSGRFKLGVALRNVGPTMKYSGDGLSLRADLGGLNSGFNSAVRTEAESFEMPSQLLISASYDFNFGEQVDSVSNTTTGFAHRVTPTFTFISNTFNYDQYGLGVEYGWNDMVFARAAYLYEQDLFNGENARNVSTGLAAGASFEMEFGKNKEDRKSKPRIGIDYSFRTTNFFNGHHSIGFRFSL